MHRRDFLRTSAAVAASTGSLASGQVAKAAASERARVGCIGAGGRALSLVSTFSADPQAEVVSIADIDSRRLPAAVEVATKNQGSTPTTTGDFRRLIDDPNIDALVIGTPDHWHAIPTILGCLAGKDVYVEKPDGHNMVEGRRMVEAMRKHRRIVQLGTQSRSTDRMLSAIEFLRTGALGRCLVAKAWEVARQGAIPKVPDADPPREVDYEMWLGPAPRRPFNPYRFHGNWRWYFDYGTGDLGNDGVHRLDVALWALSAAGEAQGDEPLGMPKTIAASGGKWYFDDAQEWPDTLQVDYEFHGKQPKLLTYEMRIWAPYRYHGESEGSAVYGDKGYLVIGNASWRAYGPGDKEIARGGGGYDEAAHVRNFLECVKSRQRPNADLETVGHPSSVLCHAGNIAWRVGRKLTLDAETETFKDDAEANALRTRPEYRKPWTLPEV